MTNFFKAYHRSTGEEILFSLGDIGFYGITNCFEIGDKEHYLGYDDSFWLSDWLKDYELFYLHQGEWFRYE
mgnify:CR=1 FL=1